MTVAKRKSSTDDKIELKRKIIRQSIDEITVAVEQPMQRENCAPVSRSVRPGLAGAGLGGRRPPVRRRLGGAGVRAGHDAATARSVQQ